MGAEYRVNIVPESCLVLSIIEKTFECAKMSINLAILLKSFKTQGLIGMMDFRHVVPKNIMAVMYHC